MRLCSECWDHPNPCEAQASSGRHCAMTAIWHRRRESARTGTANPLPDTLVCAQSTRWLLQQPTSLQYCTTISSVTAGDQGRLRLRQGTGPHSSGCGSSHLCWQATPEVSLRKHCTMCREYISDSRQTPSTQQRRGKPAQVQKHSLLSLLKYLP